jgi:CubicO group peptidase (beta-lactamase class C family)
MKRLILCLAFLLTLVGINTGDSPGLRVGTPAEAGLAPDRLGRIGRIMNEHIAANRISGAIGLIARRGKIGYFETWGMLDRENSKPMRKDSIFRMYSMTKGVTGVAAMILLEEGRLSLLEPASKYLPELAAMKVQVEKTGPDGKKTYEVVPAERQITIRDLLRHTSGFDYTGPKDEKGEALYVRSGVYAPDITIGEAVKRAAKLPLLHQPGTIWDYGISTDVLGRLVEVVSGKTLDVFFEERIFKPLGMVDTGFYVPEVKWDRLATLYSPNPDKTIKRVVGGPQDSFKKPAVMLMGGAGLTSTAMDYARFYQMLLNGGTLDGQRILSRKSVELMSADHLGDLPRVGPLLPVGFGFGLTFAVNLGPGKNGITGTEGEYYWGGAAGTRFWIDPKEQMFGIFLVQILPHTGLTYGTDFKQLAYQAIAE